MGEKFQYCWLLGQEIEVLLPHPHLQHIMLLPLFEVAWGNLCPLPKQPLPNQSKHVSKPEISFCARECGNRSNLSGRPNCLTRQTARTRHSDRQLEFLWKVSRSFQDYQQFFLSFVTPHGLQSPHFPFLGCIRLHSGGGRNPWLSETEKVPC